MRKTYTNEQIIEILKEVQSGKHPSDVAGEKNVGAYSIMTWCKRAGVSFKRKSTIYYRDWEAIKRAVGL